jgi:hypothetical protein
VRIWAFTTTHWNDVTDSLAKGQGSFGLRAWHQRVQHYFKASHCFVTCGTWSNPTLSPLAPVVPVINSGVPQGTSYDVYSSHLWGCALTAAMAYALNHAPSWDLLTLLDTDVLVGAVDFDAVLREFVARDEVLLGQRWNDTIGGPWLVWKRDGAIRQLHSRLRGNLLDPPANPKSPKPMLLEDEQAQMFRGRWWNPWPDLPTLRQDYGQTDPVKDNAAVLKWPFVRLPDPAIIDEYTRTQTALAKPVA